MNHRKVNAVSHCAKILAARCIYKWWKKSVRKQQTANSKRSLGVCSVCFIYSRFLIRIYVVIDEYIEISMHSIQYDRKNVIVFSRINLFAYKLQAFTIFSPSTGYLGGRFSTHKLFYIIIIVRLSSLFISNTHFLSLFANFVREINASNF